jgi:hypothetical protein
MKMSTLALWALIIVVLRMILVRPKVEKFKACACG